MRRRTLRQLKQKVKDHRQGDYRESERGHEPGSGYHHHVYVVLLSPEAARDRKVRAENPNRDRTKPCVYVGMSGLLPEERFWNHKNGEKSSRIVRRYGIKLLPEIFTHLNPMPFEAAAEMERDLAADLRAQGYTVAGGK